ncbi:hypothetical protein XENORESO_022247, partial [Xenotaenia resolanae]
THPVMTSCDLPKILSPSSLNYASKSRTTVKDMEHFYDPDSKENMDYNTVSNPD